MNKHFAVAIFSHHDGENSLFFVTEENECKAVKIALLESTDEDYKQSQIDWNNNLPDDDLDELLNELAQGELIVNVKEVPSL